MRRNQRGFTLIELMLSVAIVGMLATLATAQYKDMTLSAKRAEAPTLSSSILNAQLAYDATHDTFLPINWQPRRNVDKTPVPWVSGTGFDDLGWSPDGNVRCRYRTRVLGRRVNVQGHCDVDGDGVRARFHRDFATHPTREHIAVWVTPSTVY